MRDKLRELLVTVVMVAVLYLAVGYGIKLLWNGLVTGICGLRELRYWEAVGLYTLSNLLFKDIDLAIRRRPVGR